jgi:DNA-methyltransferase
LRRTDLTAYPDAPFTRLHQAHRTLDKAVDAAYGYKGGHDDGSRTALLFALYQKAAAEAGKREGRLKPEPKKQPAPPNQGNPCPTS